MGAGDCVDEGGGGSAALGDFYEGEWGGGAGEWDGGYGVWGEGECGVFVEGDDVVAGGCDFYGDVSCAIFLSFFSSFSLGGGGPMGIGEFVADGVSC